LPADEVLDQHVSLADLWGRDGARVRERLLDARHPHELLRVLEQILVERVRSLELDPCVAFAIDALDAGAPVGAVTDRLGLSPARFIRRFAAAVGVTPKRYARLRRFDRVLELVSEGRAVDWARVALDCGYFDQAHLIHEFRGFSGLSPTAYDPRSASGRHHQVL
jgi:AraC-like DNA-binding protein